MIQNMMIYTRDGEILYEWEWTHKSELFSTESKDLTNRILAPGFFSSIGKVVNYYFKDKLQRVVLENTTIVITSDITPNEKQVFFSFTVDSSDNHQLIDDIAKKLMKRSLEILNFDEISNIKLKSELDLEINSILYKRHYNRSMAKVYFAGFAVFISYLISTFIYAFIREFSLELVQSNIIPTFIGISIGIILVTPSAAIAGGRKFSVRSAFWGTLVASLLMILIFYVMFPNFFKNGGIGNPFVFIVFSLLIGYGSGNIGGQLIHRYYLH